MRFRFKLPLSVITMHVIVALEPFKTSGWCFFFNESVWVGYWIKFVLKLDNGLTVLLSSAGAALPV